MKKLFSIVAVTILSLALTAPAFAQELTDWTLDLSNVYAGGQTYTGVNSLIVSGIAQIHQNLGDDSMLTENDTFSVKAYLGTVQLDQSGFEFPQPIDTGAGQLFFYGTDLIGKVYDVVAATAETPIAKNFYGAEQFLYQYTAGTIGLYYGNPANINDENNILLNSLDIEKSVSTPTAANQFGNYLSGDLDLFSHFTDNGADSPFITDILGNIVSYYFDSLTTQVQLVFDLQNNLSLLPGAITNIFNEEGKLIGFDAKVFSSGNVTLQVTPEPSTFLIFGLGLLGLLGFRRKLAK